MCIRSNFIWKLASSETSLRTDTLEHRTLKIKREKIDPEIEKWFEKYRDQIEIVDERNFAFQLQTNTCNLYNELQKFSKF